MSWAAHGASRIDGPLLTRCLTRHGRGLARLRTLDLSNNSIGDDGARAIAHAVQGGALSRLRFLTLLGNPIGLERDALVSRNPRYIARELLSGETVHEARIIVLGEGEVGKTWLCDLLFSGRENEPGRRETHDFRHIDTSLGRVGAADLRVRVWDFGGQQILHATHELFFEARTLYLVVLNATWSRGANRLDGWLKTIRHFAGDGVPVVVAVTKCDLPEGKHPLGALDVESLRRLHPGVVGVVDGLWSEREADDRRRARRDERLEDLRRALIGAVDRVEDSRARVGREFLRVRQLVRERRPARPLVRLDEFRALCAEAGETEARFQEYALRRLHVWGDLFYFGLLPFEEELLGDREERDHLPPGQRARLTRRRDTALERWAIDPRWVSWPIYEIARESARNDHEGRLTRRQIEDILRRSEGELSRQGGGLLLEEGRFDERAGVIRSLLEHVELSFPLEDGQTYLFPRGLPGEARGKAPRELRDAEPGVLLWRAYVPESVIHRLMVHFKAREMVGDAAPPDPDDPHRIWRRGGVVTVEGVRALVELEPDAGRFEIRVDPGAPGDDGAAARRMLRARLVELMGRPPDESEGFERERGETTGARRRAARDEHEITPEMIERINEADPPHRDRALAYVWACAANDAFPGLGWAAKVDYLRTADLDGDLAFDPKQLPQGNLKRRGRRFGGRARGSGLGCGVGGALRGDRA